MPETFVVAADGTIVTRFPGPITRDIFEKRIQPAIDAAAQGSAAAQ